MKKFYLKKLTITLLVIVLPVASVLCCCMEEATAAESHPHETAPSHHHDNHHGSQSDSTHDHGQCDHGQLLAPFTSGQTSQYFDVFFQASQFQHASFFDKGEFKTLNVDPPAPPLDTGPPGTVLPSTPLYLAISVLRI